MNTIRIKIKYIIANSISFLLLTTILCRPVFCGEIHDAAKVGDLERVKALLANGADVNAKDEYGETPLHLAAEEGHKDLVALLLKNNADVNAKANSGLTPLHFAALHTNEQVAELLLENKADANAKADPGWTPLQFAATSGDKKLVTLLLDNKAVVSATDKQGWTALARALDKGHQDIADLLRSRSWADMSQYVSAAGITIPDPSARGHAFFETIEEEQQKRSEKPVSLKGNPKSATLKYSGTMKSSDDGRLRAGTERFKPTQIQTSKNPDQWIKVFSFTIGNDGFLVVSDESGASYKIKLNTLEAGVIEEHVPLNAVDFYTRGIANSDVRDFDSAIADFTKAIELKPDYKDAYNARGNAKRFKGDWDAANADYAKALELK